jgi:hypothetical protein
VITQKRQPKGTDTGGQFAASVNQESTVSLDEVPVVDLTEPVRTTEEAIAWCEGELEMTNKEYEEMVSAGKSDDPDALDMRDYMDELRDQLVDHQRDIIAELRKDREENPSLDEIIRMRTFDYLNEGDDVEEENDYGSDGRGAQDPLSPETIAADYARYQMDDPQGRDFDGAFQGIDYVVERFVDWRIADQAKEDAQPNTRYATMVETGLVDQ